MGIQVSKGRAQALAALLFAMCALHAFAAVWCVWGGSQAAATDRLKFTMVAGPLVESGGITAQANETLMKNVENRSAIHANVMYTYAVVHVATAIVLGAAFGFVRNASRRTA